jgi:tRNA-specific 2-thiouridylase
MKKKVFLALSGGVDSSVSAYLLQEQDYDITAVFFRNTDPTSKAGQYFLQEEKKAKEVADFLKIPFLVIPFEKQFKELVINPFIDKYSKGLTPNPCINCNRDFKFGIFARECFARGADYIATGHYAKTKNGRLYKAKDLEKDQSYFLNQISSDILEKTLFPLGDIKKTKVRKIAEKLNLPSKEKKDSQKICFLKGENIQEFLGKNIKTSTGDIVDIDTDEIVGQHEGIFNYTLGQRKGIEVGGLDDPYFVCGRDINKNILYVAKGRDNNALWRDTFLVKDFNFINKENIGLTKGLKAVIRYHSEEVPTEVIWEENKTGRFFLKHDVWLPAEGQSLVIYKGKECIGGGEIVEIE